MITPALIKCVNIADYKSDNTVLTSKLKSQSITSCMSEVVLNITSSITLSDAGSCTDHTLQVTVTPDISYRLQIN